MEKTFILMYEDDKDDRYITQTTFALKEYDIHIEFVTNISLLLPVLHGHGEAGRLPDLVVLDKNTPFGDSFAVLEELKQHPVYRAIPVVVLSGTNFNADVKRAYELGANSYIQKPLNDKLTVEKISSFVEYWFKTVELPA